MLTQQKIEFLIISGLVILIILIIGLVWLALTSEERHLEKLASQHEQGQKLLEQFRTAKKALKKDPQDFGAYFEIGWVKAELKDYKGAEQAYQKSLSINPKSLVAFSNLANVYIQMKKYLQAEEAFLKSLELNPSYIPTYLSLVDFYQNYYKEKKTEIEKILLKGLQEVPEHESLLSALAAYYRDTGQKGKAIETYERILRQRPGDEAIREEILKLGTPHL